MIYAPEVETASAETQFKGDAKQYKKQIAYLFAHSSFYRKKLTAAGFKTAESVGGLEDIHHLPFTEKAELRQSQADYPPFGNHLACKPEQIRRVYSTSGTTGVPCMIALTEGDLDMYASNLARGYTAAGLTAGQRLVLNFEAGPFVSGAAYRGFDKIGCVTIPVAPSSSKDFIDAIQKFNGTAMCCTPSYALYLIDWCSERGIDTRNLGINKIVTGGEPGGAEPLIRQRLTQAFQADVREAMGISDLSLTIWAEDDFKQGMHLMARGFLHIELIEPETDKTLAWEDGVQGELVYTALQTEAMPLLRFRSRDHVIVNIQENPTGRTGPRIRCIGRTDDMLIIRGQNLFPTAIAEVLKDFVPLVGETYQIRPKKIGTSQIPPLPLAVEIAVDVKTIPDDLAENIRSAIRKRLMVNTEIQLLPYGSLPRHTGKTSLLDYSYISGIKQLELLASSEQTASKTITKI